ncbi:MAG: GNAT family N-acetyltransferase [Aestuariivirga sp.]
MAILSHPAPIRDEDQVAQFDCGKAPLNDWLKTQAKNSEGKSARTYAVTKETAVVGYYCLSTGAVLRAGTPGRIRHGLPDPVPILLLGRLAVDKAYNKKGIGSGLLKDAFARALQTSHIVGARCLVVHAIDEEALAFYLKFKFQPFPQGSNTLFLPIETIARALP